MKTQDRETIAHLGKTMDDLERPYTTDQRSGMDRKINNKELKALASLFGKMATYWEKHPNRWTQDIGYDHATQTYCNMGLVWYSDTAELSNEFRVSKFLANRTLIDAYADVLIGLNDGVKSLEANIVGLRAIAASLRFASAGVPWNKAIRKGFAENAHLLQVQQARKAARV